MPKNDETKNINSITRRQFIKKSGVVAGGTIIGSSALLAACKGGEEVT